MSRELSTALQSFLSQAARNLPKSTGVVAAISARFSRAISGRTVILADTSASMDERAGAKRKIDHLREAVQDVWSSVPGCRLFRFNSLPVECSGPDELESPSGGTALHAAIAAVRDWNPERTVVISDGQPDDAAAAIREAEQLSGKVDVIYCGPDSDTVAIAFMRRLATTGGGRFAQDDVVKAASGAGLKLSTRRALGLPAPRFNF